MSETAPLFNCARCGDQVVICSCCDRGNCYCQKCAPVARQDARRCAGKRYQHSRRGTSLAVTIAPVAARTDHHLIATAGAVEQGV